MVAVGQGTVLQDAGGVGYSAVSAINALGWSVGGSYTNAGLTSSDALLWSPSGKARVLQDLGGQGNSVALGLNDEAWSVGFSSTATGQDAVLWSPFGKATDLAALLGPGWSDTAAFLINDIGDIVGDGNYDGGFISFLLTPSFGFSIGGFSAALDLPAAPETTTWAMMLLGFASLGFAGYRRARPGHTVSAA
jgi:hypothetical protein